MPQITFGKYKGSDFSDLPKDYLIWLVGNGLDPLTIQQAEYELRARQQGSTGTSKLPRQEWMVQFAALVEKMPDGLLSQIVTYKNLEIIVKIKNG